MEFNFCPKCGSKFDKDYNFCPKCGYKLGEEKAPEPLFDFSDDTAQYDDATYGGFKKQKENEEVAKKTLRFTFDDLKEIASAQKLFVNSQYKEAYAIAKKYAEKGNAEAQWILGLCYDGSCNDTPYADPEQAVYWYRKAVDQGHVYAMCMLGQCYDGGYGVPEDREKSRYWLEKAAGLGNDQAAELLDVLFNQPVEKEPEKLAPSSPEEAEIQAAEKLFDKKKYKEAFAIAEKYAEKGNARAQNLLGMCYDDFAEKTPYYDQKKAIFWYKKAAEQGDTEAMCNLGMCYEFGKGMSEDFKQARYWYQKAYDLGNIAGKNLLDEMDYFGENE